MNCDAGLGELDKIPSSWTGRCAASQAGIAAPSEGGLKFQCRFGLLDPRLGAGRRVTPDAPADGIHLGREHRGVDGLDPVTSARGRARIEQGFGSPGSDGREAGPRPLPGIPHQAGPQRVPLDVAQHDPHSHMPREPIRPLQSSSRFRTVGSSKSSEGRHSSYPRWALEPNSSPVVEPIGVVGDQPVVWVFLLEFDLVKWELNLFALIYPNAVQPSLLIKVSLYERV